MTYDFCENVVHPQTRWTDLSLIAPRKAITRSMANIDMFPNSKNKNFGCHYMILQLAVIYGVVLCYMSISVCSWCSEAWPTLADDLRDCQLTPVFKLLPYELLRCHGKKPDIPIIKGCLVMNYKYDIYFVPNMYCNKIYTNQFLNHLANKDHPSSTCNIWITDHI